MTMNPKPLMTYCTTRPPTAMMPFCSAMGAPSVSRRRAMAKSGAKSSRERRSSSIRRMTSRQYSAEKHCAMSVAAAAPAMPQWNTATNSRSSTTLIAAAMIIAYRGDLESPSARSTEEKTL